MTASSCLTIYILHFQVSEYNVPHGKKNRGLSVIASLRCFKDTLSEEEEKIARILGWCIEWVNDE